MKVLQVISSFPPAYSYGGPLSVAYRVSKELVQRRHEVTVFTTDVYDAKSRLAFQQNPVFMDGIEVYHFRNLSNHLVYRNHLCIAPAMAFALRKEIDDFDLVHLHEYRSFQAALVHRYATRKNVPYVVQAHGSLPRIAAKQNLKALFDWAYGFKMIRDANMCIALSEIEANQYERMGVEKHKIRIIKNGIDLADYENLPPEGSFRVKYGLSDQDEIVLYLGRIHKIKGIDLLLDAFCMLSKDLKNVKLVIAGPDDGFGSVVSGRIQDLRINDRVLFTGPLYGRAKLEAYRDASVYVLASRYDTFPLTVLEASASGTPVILTDRCGLAPVFERYGLVVEYDVGQLQDALYQLLTDDAKRRQLGQEMHDLVMSKFTWDEIVTEIETTYHDMLREN